jgi:glycosidase
VREEAKRIATYWLEDMGVDGFRLDAIKYLIEDGDDIQDTPGTHAFLREYAAHVRSVSPDAFTVGEVWDSTGVVMKYYPDQLDAYFAFEVADSIISAVRSGSARGLLDPVLRLQQALPGNRFATFVRNHDQTRTMTALESDMRSAKLAAAILLTLPGIPFIYYGEEIGMTGDKPDERIRTPMQWSAQPGAGFTRGTPWQPLQADSERTHVAAQDDDPGSLLNLNRRLIHLRASNRALALGELIPASHHQRCGDRVASARRRGPGAVRGESRGHRDSRHSIRGRAQGAAGRYLRHA